MRLAVLVCYVNASWRSWWRGMHRRVLSCFLNASCSLGVLRECVLAVLVAWYAQTRVVELFECVLQSWCAT